MRREVGLLPADGECAKDGAPDPLLQHVLSFRGLHILWTEGIRQGRNRPDL